MSVLAGTATVTSDLVPRVLVVDRSGPLLTVQDLGRPGYAHLGVTRSGAADRGSLRLANRLVGNREDAAGLEVTLGGAVIRATVDVLLAVTGASVPVTIGGRGAGTNAVLTVDAGQSVAIGVAGNGLRAYIAVRGGIAVPPVLGSRATDTLSGLGPAPVRDGDRLPLGELTGAASQVAGWPNVDGAPVRDRPVRDRPVEGQQLERPVDLGAVLGPRADWLEPVALQRLWSTTWVVAADSDRVGVRLDGEPLERLRTGELPSEGLVRGAIQLPPSGLPVLFLADHPVTGGYPVIAVLRDPRSGSAVDLAAQLRPGQRVRLVRR